MAHKTSSIFYFPDCKDCVFYLENWNSEDYSSNFVKYVVQSVTLDGEHVKFKCLREDKDSVEFCFPAEIFEMRKTWEKITHGA